jgi:glucose-1-phosphate thymidylyltransferase
MKVLLLAAGYGTRLYPLTEELPKALIPLGEKTLLDHLLDKIDAISKTVKIEDITVVSNNKFYGQFLKWQEQLNRDDIVVVNDGTNNPQERLGAVGDIKFGIGNHDDDWLVLGSDNFFTWNLGGFIKKSLAGRPIPMVGIYDVRDTANAKQFGVVTTGIDDRVISLVEKPQNPQGTMIATCIYFFPKKTLGFLDEYLHTHLGKDLAGQYISWLIKKTGLASFRFTGRWFDIGTREALDEAGKILVEK